MRRIDGWSGACPRPPGALTCAVPADGGACPPKERTLCAAPAPLNARVFSGPLRKKFAGGHAERRGIEAIGPPGGPPRCGVAKFLWTTRLPRRHPDSHVVRKPKNAFQVPRLAAAAACPEGTATASFVGVGSLSVPVSARFDADSSASRMRLDATARSATARRDSSRRATVRKPRTSRHCRSIGCASRRVAALRMGCLPLRFHGRRARRRWHLTPFGARRLDGRPRLLMQPRKSDYFGTACASSRPRHEKTRRRSPCRNWICVACHYPFSPAATIC